jgi:hypothetical protein
MPARGVSGVTLNDFFTAVLRGLGAPVTATNLAKLGAVARIEGHGGDYNPFNYVVPANGSTKFNSVGVQNYTDVNTGVAQTIKLLRGSRPTQKLMLANLMADDPNWNNWTTSVGNFYKSWGGHFPAVTQANAAAKLREQVDGPKVTSWGGWSGEPGPVGATITPYLPGAQQSLAPIVYHNWVTQGWNVTNQYTGLSPHLQGMMQWLLGTYGGQNLGGYGRRSIKADKSLPSAHASGAAIDWGYGGDRATAMKVMDQIAANPGLYGIQEIHDYSGLRDWRVGRGWIPQAQGSHGGDMKPGNTWLHFEVAPSRYSTPWGSAQTSGPSGQAGAPQAPFSLSNAMRSILLGSALNPPSFGSPQPSAVATAANRPTKPLVPSVAAAPKETATTPVYDLGYYSGGPERIPSAAQDLARQVAQRRVI